MRPSKGKTASVWLRSGKMQSQISISDVDDFSILKKEAKRIEIVTRMERKNRNVDSSFRQIRPKSTVNHQRGKAISMSFKDA